MLKKKNLPTNVCPFETVYKYKINILNVLIVFIQQKGAVTAGLDGWLRQISKEVAVGAQNASLSLGHRFCGHPNSPVISWQQRKTAPP